MIKQINEVKKDIVNSCRNIRQKKTCLSMFNKIVILMAMIAIICVFVLAIFILFIPAIAEKTWIIILLGISALAIVIYLPYMVIYAKNEKNPNLDDDDLHEIDCVLMNHKIDNNEKREMLKNELSDDIDNRDGSFWGVGFLVGLLATIVWDRAQGYVFCIFLLIFAVNILIIKYKDAKNANLILAIKAINSINFGNTIGLNLVNDKENDMEKNQKELETTEIINLMQVYLNEWIHRDEYFWIKTHKYFYATLIVILLPNLADRIQITMPMDIAEFACPIIGIIMSIVFIWFAVVTGKRAEVASKAYRDVMDKLPADYREESISDGNYCRLMKKTISAGLSVFMFIVLIILGGVLLIDVIL